MPARPTLFSGLLKRVLTHSYAAHSDRALLERFAESGDESAFTAIVDRHGPMLLGVCRRMLDDEHLAEDALQATFLVLARKTGSIRSRDSLASWLYGVARRLARQARLAEAARSRTEQRVAATRRGLTPPLVSDPAWSELLQTLDEELQRLPERYRAPLLLCYFEGETQDEAAKHLGWSLSTLRRRLEGGRELLRRRMTGRGATLGAGLFAGFLASTPVRAAMTPELQRAVLANAFSGARGGTIPVSILALANGGMRMAMLTKLCFGLAAAALLGGLAAGMAWRGQPDETASHFVTAPAVGNPAPVQRDLFNDPLPGGAVARLGTVAFRHGPVYSDRSPLEFTPDGKSLISSGGGWLRRWDVATGQAVVTLGAELQPFLNTGAGSAQFFATADGKIARICKAAVTITNNQSTLAWPCQCIEYDLETGKEKRTYALESPRDTHETHWLPEYLSPDGAKFIELTRTGGLTVWNAASGAFKYYLKPESEPYSAVAFMPDSKSVVVGDVEHMFRVFDLETGKELRNFELPNGNMVYRMAISPNCQWMVTAGGRRARHQQISVGEYDRFLRQWDLKDGRLMRTIPFPEDHGVQSVVFTPHFGTIVAGLRGEESGSPAAVRIWNQDAFATGREWVQDRSMGLYLAVSHDGKTLATMNGDGVIRLWDIETGKEKLPLDASSCGLEGVSFCRDGASVIAFGTDRVLSEWDAATGRRVRLARTKIKGSLLGMSPDGRYLITHYLINQDKNSGSIVGREDQGVVRLYDQASGKLLLEHFGTQAVSSPGGKRLAVRGYSQRDRSEPLEILEIESGKVIQTIVPPQEQEAAGRRGFGVQGGRGIRGSSGGASAGRPLAFTPDGKSLIVLDGQETLSLWDVATAKQTKTWSLTENGIVEKQNQNTGSSRDSVYTVAVSPDGSQIAFGLTRREIDAGRYQWFGRLVVAEATTGKILFQNDWKPDYVGKLAFSPDSKLLAMDAGLRTIRVWDTAAGRVVKQFEGHRGRIRSLAFSPDGKRLASASDDSTALIWDVAK